MKKSSILLVLFGMVLFSCGFVQAASAELTNCRPSVEIVNQDPYPANPGEYVKVVFQLDGLNNPDCDKVSFELKEGFPFSMDPDETRAYEFSGAIYARDFKSTALAPYQLRVDEDAIDGDNKIEGILKYTNGNGEVISELEEFDINVNGVKVDFDVSVKDLTPRPIHLHWRFLTLEKIMLLP